MTLRKKLLAASVAAVFVASPVYADNSIDIDGQLDLINEVLDDSLDIDDAMVRVVSSAMNFATIDASVSITGASIDFNSANSASATATSTADSLVVDANATVSAISSATSGNAIKTNAIGAVNDTTVNVTNELAYLRGNTLTATFNLDGEVDQETIRDSVEGGAIAGEYAFMTGLGGVIIGEGMFGDTDNGVAVFQSAYNTGDINASVAIASADTSYYTRGIRDNLDINDLAISTNAIGAVNSGGVTVANSLVVDVQSTVTYGSTVTGATEIVN